MPEPRLSRQAEDGDVLVADVRRGDTVWVRSEQFRTECVGHVWDLTPNGLVHVSLELPEDSSAVRDALGDNPDLTYETLEFTDIVSPSALMRQGGPETGWRECPVRVWKRPPTSAERARRHRARGGSRITLPDLDSGLRRPAGETDADRIRRSARRFR